MKKLFYPTLLLTLVWATDFAQPAIETVPTAAVQSTPLPPFWKDILKFKQRDSVERRAGRPILFVGSSSFTKWTDMQDYFPGYPLLNRGFGGSVLTDVIRYTYDVIIPYDPKQVLIYCGDNDLAAGTPADEVVRRFKTLFGMIRTNLPGTVIDYVSIKYSPSREKLYPQVTAANKAIKEFLSKQPKAGFIDINPGMRDKAGRPREELFLSDMLHVNAAGYEIWKKAILPYLIK